MGLFRKNKSTASSASVLTESEIQKKLYGDLITQAPHVVIGEREHFKEPAPYQPPPKKNVFEKEPTEDLFSSPQVPAAGADFMPVSGEKTIEPTPRYVPLHDFENRAASQASVLSGAASSSRFSIKHPVKNRLAALADLFKTVLDPQHAIFRRVGLWSALALVVFLLFWGVNALNSQREVAMHTRYTAPQETPVAQVKTSEAETVRSTVAAPASAKAQPSAATQPSQVAAVALPVTAPAKGSYVIQVVTYPTRQDADQIVATFRKAGIHAYVKENSRPSGRLFFLVLIRGGRTEEEAQSQLLKFKANEVARPFQDAFVNSSRS